MAQPITEILVPNYRGKLTEGITYNKSNNSVLWVDIMKAEIHRYFLDTGKRETLTFAPKGESLGTLGLTKNDDEIILGAKDGVARGSFKTGKIEYFLKYSESNTDRLRSNDGKIDPNGNLIIGTMLDFPYDSSPTPEGKLYRINCKTLEIETLIEPTGIANGLGFNSSLTTFYWTDSPTKTIYKFDYDKATDKITNKRPFFKTTDLPAEEVGFPDGMCITEDDEIYTALFGSGMVIRLNEQGDILGKYKLPAKQITCCTVGGKNGDELFVNTALTDAEDGTSEEREKSGDMGGSLFRFKLDKLSPEQQFIWGN